ncbi:hypothetical protein NKG05_06495 [Oerskovia sp. M15]
MSTVQTAPQASKNPSRAGPAGGHDTGFVARLVTNPVVRKLSDRRLLPVTGTMIALAVILVVGQVRYSTDRRDFLSMRLFSNLLVDNSYLIVLAIGMTFVIITGDRPVGRCGGRARGPGRGQAPDPGDAAAGGPDPRVLIGTTFGLLIGVMVQYFDIQPFIASLAAMFLARGLANVVSVQSLAIKDEGFASLASWKIKFGEGRESWSINLSMVIAFVVLLIAIYLLHYTRFGRTVYGLGAGDGGTAVNLMGLKGSSTKVWVYVISGTCAGIAGILFAFYTKSGFNLTGIGMELDAIAAVVIGGALLTGGGGFVLGSVAGVLVYGLIQVLIAREGLDSWWTKVFIGVVLLAFVLLQRAMTFRQDAAAPRNNPCLVQGRPPSAPAPQSEAPQRGPSMSTDRDRPEVAPSRSSWTRLVPGSGSDDREGAPAGLTRTAMERTGCTRHRSFPRCSKVGAL